ncbi:MAG: hypothetical protein IJB98_00915 [Clostridia bacterium]|nr:hypothetical protein [Clostridia bacterium]
MYNSVMFVYRVVKEPELINLLEGNIEKLGNYFSRVKNRNTHKYKENQKYLHLFKRKSAYQNYFHSIGEKPNSDYYLVTLNVPFKNLILHSAKGFYFPVGYDVDVIIEREYAIPAEKFEPSWIVGYEQVYKCQKQEEKDCLDK